MRLTENPGISELLDGPKDIKTVWGIPNFESFDRVLSEPGSTNGAYVFCRNQYARIKVNPEGRHTLVSGPKVVGTYWPALKKAGFYP